MLHTMLFHPKISFIFSAAATNGLNGFNNFFTTIPQFGDGIISCMLVLCNANNVVLFLIHWPNWFVFCCMYQFFQKFWVLIFVIALSLILPLIIFIIISKHIFSITITYLFVPFKIRKAVKEWIWKFICLKVEDLAFEQKCNLWKK